MAPPLLSPDRFRAIAQRFPDRSVLVVGDVMIDEYVHGDAARISPEAPVPIVEVTRESLRLGGVVNVARNLVTLGGRVELLAVVGTDSRAGKLRGALTEQGIDPEGLVDDPSRPTTLKTRIIAGQQQVVRVDRESRESLSEPVRGAFVARLRAAMERAGGVIVSDYGKGVVDLEMMGEIATLARRLGLFVAVDPKESHFYQYKHVSIVTPNVHEAGRATRLAIRDLRTLEEAGRQLLADLDSEAVLITRGPEGMSLFRKGQDTLHIPVMAREVWDVTGAGDTVIATFTLARVAGASLEEAAVMSNAAAAVVVGKMGTAAVHPPELQNALEIGYPAGKAS